MAQLINQIALPLQACEMMLFGKKLTAAEAKTVSLITDVFPDHSFQKEVWVRLKEYAALPKNVSRSTAIIKHQTILALWKAV